MKNTLKGHYRVMNPEKYAGTSTPIYRSSWELTVMRMCDNNPSIIQWASESVKIPYRNPLTGKYTVYVPDFLVVFEDQKGNRRAELWEIKPRKQTYLEEAKSKRDKLALAVNSVKWQAAHAFAKKHSLKFRVITETDLFHNN